MSMASSILGRGGKVVLPATAAAAFVVVGSQFGVGGGPFDDRDGKSMARRPPPTSSSCEAPPPSSTSSGRLRWVGGRSADGGNPFLTPDLRETVLRRKMTAVGRFSLISETDDNRSIPVFFLALSGEKKKREEEEEETSGGDAATATTVFSPHSTSTTFSVSDLEDAWIRRNMPVRHPRFHSVVCPERIHFEETHRVHPTGHDGDDDEGTTLRIKADLERHATETAHFAVYREDLRKRLEHMITSPLEVSDRLWEVKVSTGPLGSSGAICRAKADSIMLGVEETDRRRRDALPTTPSSTSTTRGGTWRDVANEIKAGPTESVLLFRCHHALADGASIMAALSDLCDEAEEIRANVEGEFKKWRSRGREGKATMGFLRRILSRLMRLLRICAWFALGTTRALIYQGYLQITTRANPFDAVLEDAKRRGPVPAGGRSISWCDAAPLDEVKGVARSIGKSRGVGITVNDLFVSCVTSAVTRQLVEHEEYAAEIHGARDGRKYAVPAINVVVPVHLRGGIILPGESVGNNIGAFVARCPGEMKCDTPCSPTERLVRVHRSLLRAKGGPAPLVSHHVARFCSDHLPDWMTKAIFKRANANAAVVVSNNRGYDRKLHISGMAVESAAGFIPLPPGIPIGVVVQSYNGTVSLSLTAESWAVPDADKFLGWVLDEYRRLCSEASKSEGKRDNEEY
ncbi:hypothetical protein ACHAXA_001228 [Cyclostephanos tholiformis]|uniref:O-acyltransferase WSD1 C-terminal domain-containing protein n=1 Tax=Cyclostephanos tholiformis TaxID=382380 RepID=A0ABD3RBA4_9STRA